MKIRHKTVLAIAAVCSCICMFCIGFANWSMGTPSSTVTGNISAEDVYYIEFAGVTGLDYGPDGFVGESIANDDPYCGTLSVTYKFYCGNIYNKVKVDNVSVEIILEYSEEQPAGSSIFTKDTKFVTAGVTSGAVSANPEPNSEVNDTACILTFSLNLAAASEESYTEITATFNFNLNESTYKTYIYDGKTKFTGFRVRALIGGNV